MAIPTYEKMLRPILELAAKGDISRRGTIEPIENYFRLSSEERAKTIQSGATVVHSRVGWAMTFLTKASLIEKVVRGQYRITDDGRAFLVSHPTEIKVKDLRARPGWKDAWKKHGKPESGSSAADDLGEEQDEAVTPAELVDRGVRMLREDLSERLLKIILSQSATFFEHLVLDVLLAMGYGGSRESAAAHLGRAGDEGIDGRVNQDALGLDQIMVQAKRYAPDRPVDRQTVQAFIGSLAGQGVTKGIVITTSYFNDNAMEFVKRGSNTKVVLVDGRQLIDLMMRHHIGVRIERSVELLELDQNYFDDE